MTKNTETLNALNVKVREFSISKLMDWRRERDMKWFYECHEAAAKTTILTKKKKPGQRRQVPRME